MVVGVPIRLTDLALPPPCVLLQWGKDGRVVLLVQTLPLAPEEIAEEEGGGEVEGLLVKGRVLLQWSERERRTVIPHPSSYSFSSATLPPFTRVAERGESSDGSTHTGETDRRKDGKSVRNIHTRGRQ